MIKDFTEIKPMQEVFHFKHSLRPFVLIEGSSGNALFIDLNEKKAYDMEDLEYDGLDFYEDAKADYLLGVKVDGTLEDWI